MLPHKISRATLVGAFATLFLLKTATCNMIHKLIVDQVTILELKFQECVSLNNTSEDLREESGWCPSVWDGVFCWPAVPSDVVHRVPCPNYIMGFRTEGYADRYCTSNGTWYAPEMFNTSWSNYSDCYHNRSTEHVDKNYEKYLHVIKTLSRVGYSVSLSTLCLAFCVLAFIKRLRCPRNNLHMHLFVSFILRAFTTLLKDGLFVVGLPGNFPTVIGQLAHFDNDNNWECKFVTSVWHYFLMANYFWILMEGLYLHNLIFMALFSDNNGIMTYVILGWGLPLVFIAPWVAARSLLEDTLCWTVNLTDWIFWIIRGPITLTIVIDFVVFLIVTRILFIKLQTSYAPDSRKKRFKKLARSTLVLVPLFGVHYTAFLVMTEAAKRDEYVEVIWLFCDQFFTSFQGFVVAVLYCFLNGEVQGEIRKKWQRWHLYHVQGSTSRSSLATQSLTLLSRNQRNSLHSCTLSAVIMEPGKKDCLSVSPSPGIVRKESYSRTPSPKKADHNLDINMSRWSCYSKSSDVGLAPNGGHNLMVYQIVADDNSSLANPTTQVSMSDVSQINLDDKSIQDESML